MTNFIRTDQRQAKCDEDPRKHKAICKSNKDCKTLDIYMNGWDGYYYVS